MKNKFVQVLIWITMMYFIFTSLPDIEMTINILEKPYLLDATQNYFLVSLIRLFVSLTVFFWTLYAIFCFFKKIDKFKTIFINICIFYGFAQSLYAPAFHYKSLDPNYFNYFIWMPNEAINEVVMKSVIVFIVAFLASRYINIKAST